MHTVGELLGYEPSALTRAKGVPDATRKEILAQVRTLSGQVPAPLPGPAPDQALPHGIEAVRATLLPPTTGRGSRDPPAASRAARSRAGRRWPVPALAGPERGGRRDRPQPTADLDPAPQRAPEWLKNEALHPIRNELVALLDKRGTVMSATELAEAFIAARGSYSEGPRRLAQAIGLVRAAVEAELARGGDARVAIQRFRESGIVLVGREPDDPAAATTAAQRLAYAVRLGRRAIYLSTLDLPATRQRALETLRAMPPPDDMPMLDDQRRLRLAAEASNDRADVDAQGQFYPVGMSAVRALKLALGSLAGQRLPADQVQARVRARFPRAQPLPARPALTDLLAEAGVPLAWDPAHGVYAPPSLRPPTSTRVASILSVPATGLDDRVMVAGSRLAVARAVLWRKSTPKSAQVR